jgi:uncharacterized protein Yka (UPF0111/DUF47 family)
MAATTLAIISTIIGSVVTVTAMSILMLKFVKEPLEERIDRLDLRIDRLEKRVDDLYQMLLNHFMNGKSDKEKRT